MTASLAEAIFFGVVGIIILAMLWRMFVNRQLMRAYRRRHYNPDRLVQCRYCRFNYTHPGGQVDCLKRKIRKIRPYDYCSKFMPREDDYVHY